MFGNIYHATLFEINQTLFLKVGDTVRAIKKGQYEKLLKTNWSREIFTVHKNLPKNPKMFKFQNFRIKVIYKLLRKRNANCNKFMLFLRRK